MKILKKIKAKALIAFSLFMFLSVSAMADGGTMSGISGVRPPPCPANRVRALTYSANTGFVYFEYVPAGSIEVQYVTERYEALKDGYKKALGKSALTTQLESVTENSK